MRAFVPAYELRAPPTLSATLELLGSEPGAWRAFAGGTDLMVLFEAGKLAHRKYLSIRHLPELQGIEVTPAHVTLGALTTYTEIQRHETLRQEFPNLRAAARETGGVAIQNRGTLGGNVANASPAADTPPALIVYDAQLELISAAGGSRWLAYSEFHTGYKQTLMRPDELLGRIRLPRRDESWRHYYRKVGTRKAQAISKTCLAGAVLVAGGRVREIRLAVGSVAPTVVRCLQTEAVLRGRQLNATVIHDARESLAREIAPIDDVRSTASYRLRVSQNLLEEMLTEFSA
ncbi:MAG: xanthine dehydrogenase family protein subunit M [Pyrinomonadaceae bacterium]|nr:xanthine dehydrogenase family protein subunit M [Pyrinomonadaceae bacterium]